MNRRDFSLKSLSVTAAILLPFQSFKVWAEEACKDLIDMSGKKRKDKANSMAVGMAKNFKYVEDIDKAMKAGTVKDRKAKDANCANCVLYTSSNDKCGKCTIIPGVSVHKNGWCQTWNRKKA